MTPPRVYKPFLKNVSRSGKIRRGKCESAPSPGEHMPRGRGRAQGIAPTMRRLRMPGCVGWQGTLLSVRLDISRSVSFASRVLLRNKYDDTPALDGALAPTNTR